ncbi:MAG: ABC transporter substrate-binding protein [Nitrospira sp.]
MKTTHNEQHSHVRFAINLCLAAVLPIILWIVPAAATEPESHASLPSATESVKGTITDLLKVLDDQELKQPDRADDRRSAIERIVMRRVSYEEMAKRALGTTWAELSPDDRREFVELFVQLLRDTFAGRISEHDATEVAYLGEQRDQGYAEVKTRLKGPKVDTLVDFRLLLQSEDWLVYDAVVDGASIVSNYRAQFASIIRDVSYVGLVKKMKQKAVAVKFFEHAPAR